MNASEVNNLLKKPGYGIASSFPKSSGIKSQFSESTRKKSAYIAVCDAGQGSDLEHGAGHEPVCAQKTTLNYSGQCVVRVKAFRKRLVDVDGNCIKYHLDFLRYIGAIKDDNDAAIRLIFEGQEKVATESEERLEVTLEYPSVDFDKLFVSEPAKKEKKR